MRCRVGANRTAARSFDPVAVIEMRIALHRPGRRGARPGSCVSRRTAEGIRNARYCRRDPCPRRAGALPGQVMTGRSITGRYGMRSRCMASGVSRRGAKSEAGLGAPGTSTDGGKEEILTASRLHRLQQVGIDIRVPIQGAFFILPSSVATASSQILISAERGLVPIHTVLHLRPSALVGQVRAASSGISKPVPGRFLPGSSRCTRSLRPSSA